MHLVSRTNQTVRLKSLDQNIKFIKGETIHTENSYKFTLPGIGSLMKRAGFQMIESWTDPKNYFALCLFQPND